MMEAFLQALKIEIFENLLPFKSAFYSRTSCRFHQPQACPGRMLRHLGATACRKAARQLEMRGAVARALATRMTAKGDRLALLVAAIRVTAVAV
jgi:hypothetical protein